MVKIEGPELDLLIDLSTKRFVPSEPELAPLRDGDWAEFKFADYQGRLVLDGADLKVFMPAEIGRLRTFIEMMGTRNQPATVALADGSTVHAELAHMKHVRDEAELSRYFGRHTRMAHPLENSRLALRPQGNCP